MATSPKHYRIEATLAGSRRGGGGSARYDGSGWKASPPYGVWAGDAVGPAAGTAFDRRAPIDGLERELLAMQDAIAMTKREVATLRRSGVDHVGMHRATSELDAVAVATERATSAILGAIEEIEGAANLLKVSAGGDARGAAIAGTIIDRILVLYEACNFQDITGQRIKKVVGTLKFVESGLDRVIAAWGDAMPAPLGDGGETVRGGDRTLVHGPSLPGDRDAVTQVEIDAFFS